MLHGVWPSPPNCTDQIRHLAQTNRGQHSPVRRAGAASLLTLRVLTCSNVVTEATTTTTASATANKISAVGWLSKKPMARTRHANTEWLVDCDSDDWISLFVVRPAVAAL